MKLGICNSFNHTRKSTWRCNNICDLGGVEQTTARLPVHTRVLPSQEFVFYCETGNLRAEWDKQRETER